MTFRAWPLHQHTTRREPNQCIYAYKDFYGGKAHIPTTGGGGVTALYKPYRYVPPQMVGFSFHSSLKTGTDFAHFDLELGMVFEKTTGVYKRICCFNSK